MAIHAVCTTPGILIFFNSLIYKEFIIFKCWHNRCNLLCMLAIQVHTELKDMSLIQEKFTSLFSNFDVTTAPRPDGGILLTLRSSDGKVFKRALTYQQLHAGDQLSWAISAIRRDLAEQASELPQIAMLQSQQRFALPTYHSL
ncbi:Succinate dehydrogenase/fumarate reductase flavoprotein subunit [Pseudomonas sp. IT-P395]